jgi:hypothetical protein
MPISRTVEGLLAELKCDDKTGEGWQFNCDPTIHHTIYYISTGIKKEGTGSLYFSESRPSGPGEGAEENSARTSVNIVNGMRLHCWVKTDFYIYYYDIPHNELSFVLGGRTIVFDVQATQDWTFKKYTVNAGNGAAKLWWSNWHAGAGECYFYAWIDHIVLSRTQYVVVTGLIPGQKVEIYRASDNVKITEATCAAGQTSVSLDVDAEEYPEYMYLKIYASDGSTLIETTPSYKMSGGDQWSWTSPTGTLSVTGTPYLFYRTSAVATPKSASITATLKTEIGDPVPGKTIYFSTSLGTVDPTSDVTDANGEAHTTLTSGIQGIAVAKCNWPGDADLPAAVVYSEHHVFYDAEEGDSDKSFQFYIEGKEFSYVGGEYALATETTPQEFSVEIPEWTDGIIPRGLVSIYRLGVAEYSGVLTKIHRDLSESPQVRLGGTDSKSLLETRVVTFSDYSLKTLTQIVTGLLNVYPCAVSVGEIESYPNSLSITLADEYLVSSISRVVNLIGWFYRVTAARKLDVASSFGVSKPDITFTEGLNLFGIAHDEDHSQIQNNMRMRGSSTLVSTVFDDSSIGAVGKLDGIAFQKTIVTQSTLDIAANAELARTTTGVIKISGDVLDDYDPDSWRVGDWVTITSDYVDLSDSFKVVLIRRDLADPTFAHIECSNRAAVELGDLFEKLKRELKDLNVS